MTEKHEPRLPSVQPGRRSYALLKQYPPPTATPPPVSPKPLFTMNITAVRQQSGRDCMETNKTEHNAEHPFFLDILFKPNESGLRLRPAETQLLLAHIGEILKQVEIEEKIIMEEQNTKDNAAIATQTDEVTSCK